MDVKINEKNTFSGCHLSTVYVIKLPPISVTILVYIYIILIFANGTFESLQANILCEYRLTESEVKYFDTV